MPQIRPFRGLRYRIPVQEIGRVLCPPYDVISPAEREAFLARHPRNVVRAVLSASPDEAGYAEAGEAFRRWQQEGVIAPDPAPSLYLLEQRFTIEGRPLGRLGLLARFRIEEPSARVILPHEQTRKAPREDRFRMLLATRANFSPIFMMYPDPGDRLAALTEVLRAHAPEVEYTDDAGTGHRLWPVADASLIGTLVELFGTVKAYIADGHHRYATALRYRDEVGPEGAWSLGYFAALEDPGLAVLPYHRILDAGPSLAEARNALEGMFLLGDAASVAEGARAAAHSTMPYAFALAEPGGGALVAEALPEAEDLLDPAAPPSLRALDAYFLHRAVLPRLGVDDDAVRYVHSLREAEEAVAERRCRLAVLMRGTPVRQIVDVAEAGESMPAKSTFFHPKLPSGLVIHPLPTPGSSLEDTP